MHIDRDAAGVSNVDGEYFDGEYEDGEYEYEGEYEDEEDEQGEEIERPSRVLAIDQAVGCRAKLGRHLGAIFAGEPIGKTTAIGIFKRIAEECVRQEIVSVSLSGTPHDGGLSTYKQASDALERIHRELGGEGGIVTATDLIDNFDELRQPIVDGLLRRGETVNIVAATKMRKSWLVLHLTLAVANGLTWLGFPVRRGKVLLIDCELHPETLAHRLMEVGTAMNLGAGWRDNLHIMAVRGKSLDLAALSHSLGSIAPGTYDLIVLDPWYRLRAGGDENANSEEAAARNMLDQLADRLNARNRGHPPCQ